MMHAHEPAPPSIGKTSYCAGCCTYHVVHEPHRVPYNERERKILKYVALGFTNREIGMLIHLSFRQTEGVIQDMIKRMEARSRPHLVAIAIALGMVDPTEFVPRLMEKRH
jgi:DNA-binding NarL/FixJ family response regulator